jgi:hypothetical protein
MQKNSQRELAERAVILWGMPEEKYWELRKKYGHDEVYKAVSSAVKALRAPFLVRVSRRIRWRLEQFLVWGQQFEVKNGDPN